ncbi:probable hippurate hydrolase [Phialocephala subalpina]|uniref:Probable hippurate hydrolase n=1 Tax=Phialocephala subalpina TaxID=576137 RepID=A0A1L7WDY9_9HELO|nr:probable hippurate hydrolase [Phialocephala subalpina]
MLTKTALAAPTFSLAYFEETYKNLHQYAGLSLQEHFAAGTAAQHLKSLSDFEVTERIGGYGLIGVLRNGEGKTVLLRADMDALPIEELTELEYASQARQVDVEDGIEKPVMHACGHDIHVACLLAAASNLHAHRHRWNGTLVILFQPNEERGGGARAMIDDGLYNQERHNCPIPDVVLGQHLMNSPSGQVGIRSGSFMSASDSFKVTVYGRGGHASMPHLTVDPVVIASFIVTRLQTIISREVDPNDTAVVTVGSIQAGDTANIIPAEAVLKINIRTFKSDTREKTIASIRRIVKAECEAGNSPKEPLIEHTGSVPGTVNDETTKEQISQAFKAHFGPDFFQGIDRVAASEDFSILATEAPNKEGGIGVPYCYWTFGGTDPELWEDARKGGKLDEIPSNHSPFFAPIIQPTLKIGMEALVVAAMSYLDLY